LKISSLSALNGVTRSLIFAGFDSESSDITIELVPFSSPDKGRPGGVECRPASADFRKARE